MPAACLESLVAVAEKSTLSKCVGAKVSENGVRDLDPVFHGLARGHTKALHAARTPPSPPPHPKLSRPPGGGMTTGSRKKANRRRRTKMSERHIKQRNLLAAKCVRGQMWGPSIWRPRHVMLEIAAKPSCIRSPLINQSIGTGRQAQAGSSDPAYYPIRATHPPHHMAASTTARTPTTMARRVAPLVLPLLLAGTIPGAMVAAQDCKVSRGGRGG